MLLKSASLVYGRQDHINASLKIVWWSHFLNWFFLELVILANYPINRLFFPCKTEKKEVASAVRNVIDKSMKTALFSWKLLQRGVT